MQEKIIKNSKKVFWLKSLLVISLIAAVGIGLIVTLIPSDVTVHFFVGNDLEKQVTLNKGTVLSTNQAPDVEMEGYTFTGWHVDKSTKTKHSFKKPIKRNTKLYAGFTLKTVTFKIYLNDKTEDYYEITGNYWAEENLLNSNYLNANLSEEYKNNYKLIGFVKNSESTEPDFNVDGSIILKQPIADLHMLWERCTASITYDAGNGTLLDVTSPQTVYTNSQFKLPPSTNFVANTEGYVLDCFNADINIGDNDTFHKYYAEETITVGTENITFTAYYKENKTMLYEGGDMKIYSVNNSDLTYTDFGEYPKSYVGDKLNSRLEELYNNGELKQGLTATNKNWSANSSTGFGDYKEKQNIEYGYNNDRYVRVSSIRSGTGEYYKFNDDTLMGATGTIYWFKVEPIKWLILNWDNMPSFINSRGNGTATELEIVAADIIIAGVPFYPNTNSDISVLWQNSTTRAWLNGISTINITENGNLDYTAPDGGDFTNKGFINSAFSSDEINKIKDSLITNTNNKGEGNSTPAGIEGFETTDKIYLLSYYDMFNKESPYNSIFKGNEERHKKATDYAKAHNATVFNTAGINAGYTSYLIRSSNTSVYIYTINHIGAPAGNYANRNYQGMLPAMQLEISFEGHE